MSETPPKSSVHPTAAAVIDMKPVAPNFNPKALTANGILQMAVLIVLESTVVSLAAASKTSDNRPPYNTSSIVLIVELLKLTVSLFSLWQAGQQAGLVVTHSADAAKLTGEENGLGELRRLTLGGFLKYGVPGFLYMINNNLFLTVLTMMPPAYFQLLLNSRVVWTGLAFRWFMGRELTKRQWIASFTLLLGCVLSQYGGSASGDSVTVVSATGLILTGVYCAISVSASVYNELLMKTEPSLHVANVQLYAFGVLFNVFTLLWQSDSAGGGFWRGWQLSTTWAICCFNVVIGLLISRVMKNFDSIMKIFCIACSNLLVYCVSVYTGTQELTAQFLAAFVIVSVAGYRYSTPGDY